MAEVGKTVADVSYLAEDGTTRSLSHYRGKKLVVYFYPKDDTSGCTKEAIEFTAQLPAFAKANTAVIGFSKDSVKSHAKFAGKHQLKVDLGSDESGAVCEAFGVWVEKSMYGKKYMGIERSTFLLDENGVVLAAWRKVKVPGHVDAVLRAVQSA